MKRLTVLLLLASLGSPAHAYEVKVKSAPTKFQRFKARVGHTVSKYSALIPFATGLATYLATGDPGYTAATTAATTGVVATHKLMKGFENMDEVTLKAADKSSPR